MIVKTRKYHQSSSQKCIRILSKLFVKSNISGEHKFEKFSQLSTIGRRITCLVINLALGGRTKTTHTDTPATSCYRQAGTEEKYERLSKYKQYEVRRSVCWGRGMISTGISRYSVATFSSVQHRLCGGEHRTVGPSDFCLYNDNNF